METASALPPSYEGLRVRGRAQAPDPRQLTALRQPQPAARSRGDEFFDFVSEFIHLVFLPYVPHAFSNSAREAYFQSLVYTTSV